MVSLNHKHQLLVNKIKNISPNNSPIVETSLRNSFFSFPFFDLCFVRAPPRSTCPFNRFTLPCQNSKFLSYKELGKF